MITKSDVVEFLGKFPVCKENAIFPKDACLTLSLDKRLHDYQPDDANNIKLMLAPSGAGKTRTLFELLYQKEGIYLNFSGNHFPALDVLGCYRMCLEQPERAKSFMTTLVRSRSAVLSWLKADHAFTPPELLFVQLYPDQVFSCNNVFALVFDYFLRNNHVDYDFRYSSRILVVDEIQETLAKETIRSYPGFSQQRPLLSPLILSMKYEARCFILSGTDISYELLRTCTGSKAMKGMGIFEYCHVNDFIPLDANGVRDYSKWVLSTQTKRVLSSEEIEEIAEAISQSKFAIGRGRFSAFVLDAFIATGNLDLAFEKQEFVIRNTSDPSFPLKFVTQNPKSLTDIRIGHSTLHDKIVDLYVSALLNGKATVQVNDQDSSSLINYGIGFRKTVGYNQYTIELCEPAVVESIGYVLEFQYYMSKLLGLLIQSPTKGCAGEWFEYIVGAAVVENFKKVEAGSKRPGKSSQILKQYLQSQPTDNTDWIKPINTCGPDVVYMVGNEVWFVQAKIGKSFKMEHASETTDYRYFYCVRKKQSSNYRRPINGYVERHQSIQPLMQGKIVYRIVVAPWAKSDTVGVAGVQLISPYEDDGDFFRHIRPPQLTKEGFWELLSDACE